MKYFSTFLLQKAISLLSCCLFIGGLLLLGVTNAKGQPCLPEGYAFCNQQDVDDFLINYSDCTEILGDIVINKEFDNLEFLMPITIIHGSLLIEVTHLKSLNGLENLTEIGGSLRISNSDSLYSLSGLDQLQKIKGDLLIGNNRNLITLSELNQLEQIDGRLRVSGNSKLLSLEGLNQLTQVNGGVSIHYNPKLTTLTSLIHITQVNGDVSIFDNPKLTTLAGLNQLAQVNGDLFISQNIKLESLIDLTMLEHITGEVTIQNNHELNNLSGLEKIKVINGNLKLRHNSKLDNLTGLNQLERVKGNFMVYGHSNLENLVGLDNLKYIERELLIEKNSNLLDLRGLESLEFVGGSLRIVENEFLQELTGLGSIQDAGLESVEIKDNSQLKNIEALNNVGLHGILELVIINNHKLSECGIFSVCNYLLNYQNAIIEDNGGDCQTVEYVKESCFSDYFFHGLTLAPNPADQYLYLTHSDQELKDYDYEIFDKQGRKINKLFITDSSGDNRLDVSSLTSGLYYLKVTFDELSKWIRFVKK